MLNVKWNELFFIVFTFRFNSLFKTEVDLATYSKNFVKIKEKVWEIGKRSAENRELVL